MTEPARLMSVLRDKSCVGFITLTGRGFKAYDQAGKPLGYFENEHAAARMVYASATSS